jgi:lipoprotein signal peptidase
MLACLAAVPLLDQAVKWIVVGRLGGRTIPLGMVGEIRAVRGRVWIARAVPRTGTLAMWLLWAAAAASGAAVSLAVPALAVPCGLLLGGSLSHALETSLRGSVCDWVCLRFWPAFDLADVALTAGGLALAVELAAALHTAVR